MRSPRVLAVDFGAERIACALFVAGAAGRMVLERFATETRRRDVAPTPACTASEVASVVRAALGGTTAPRSLRVVWPPHLTLTKYVKTPAVGRGQQPSALAFEAAENIPPPLNEVVWDSVVTSDDGLDLEVTFAATKLGPVRAACAAVESAGFTVEAIAPAAFVLRHGFRFNHPEIDGPVAVANIGARSTTLALLEGDRFGFRTFAIGGGDVTQAMADELGIDVERAEKLKLEVLSGRSALPSNSPARETVRRLSAAFAERAAAELARSILHVRRQAALAAPTSVWLSGGGSLLPDLTETLTTRLALPVRRFEPLRAVDLSADARAAGADSHAPRLAELVGVAAEWTSKNPLRADLLPPEIVAARAARQCQRWTLLAAALFGLAALPPIFRYERLAASSRREAARWEEQLRPLRAVQARNAENLRQLGQAQTQLAALRRALEVRTSWVEFLGDLQSRLGQVEDVWLDRLQLVAATTEPGDGPAGGPKGPAALRLALSGRLLDVANPQARVSPPSVERVERLLASIRRSPFVAEVENERFDNVQNGLLRFDFTVAIKPERPL